MKISIAVPSFNQGKFIGACLESIARQSHEDFEVLVADGGSTDGALEIIERYVDRDDRFRLVSRSDEGQADAIVKAFSQAQGEVLGFLNSDDCYTDDRSLQWVAEAMAQHADAGLVSFGGEYLDAEGRSIGDINLRRHPWDSLRNLPYRASVLQPGTFWRRHVYEEIGIRTEFHYAFDAIFFYFAHLRFRWVEFDRKIAGYRLHGTNKSAGVRSDRIAELARFERMKFGEHSGRALYLDAVSATVKGLRRAPLVGGHLTVLLRIAVNGLSCVSFYRIPGI